MFGGRKLPKTGTTAVTCVALTVAGVTEITQKPPNPPTTAPNRTTFAAPRLVPVMITVSPGAPTSGVTRVMVCPTADERIKAAERTPRKDRSLKIMLLASSARVDVGVGGYLQPPGRIEGTSRPPLSPPRRTSR